MEELKACPFCEYEQETPDRKFCASMFTTYGCDYVGIAFDKKTEKYFLHAESEIYDYMEDREITTCPVCGKSLNRRTAPENKPLTLELLQQMDGSPIWVAELEEWAIVTVDKYGQFANMPFAQGKNFNYNIEARNMACLRPQAGTGG